MNKKQYKLLRIIIAGFICVIVALAIAGDDILLLAAGLITGVVFWLFLGSKRKAGFDERDVAIREKAAHLTYIIFAPTLGISALIMLFPSHSGLEVFANGNFTFLESLGIVFACLTLFLIVLYALSTHFVNRQYGGGDDEE
jgi:hypothetical protein